MDDSKGIFRVIETQSDGKVVRHFSLDFEKRKKDILAEHPDSIVEQIEGKTTIAEAWAWLENVIEVASLHNENYKEVIEIRVPVRFYWDKEGNFDGIEFGEFKTQLQPWEEDMCNRCLQAISPVIGKE